MRLYLSPGACSLADHIALHEGGFTFDRTKVDLKSHKTEDGRDYKEINPKGYVPALTLDGGELLTENIAILSWVADNAASLAPPKGYLGKYRLLETLAFVSTELHKQFKPLFSDADEKAKTTAKETISKRLGFIARHLKGPFLLGDSFSVADCYLFVMLMWTRKNHMALPEPLQDYAKRISERPAVKLAFAHEELEAPSWT